MTSLQLSLLGTFELRWDGRPITQFPTDKVRALLAYLALEADRPIRRETLAALLWPDWSDDVAKRNLRQNLHRLNQLLDKLEPDLSKKLLTVSRSTVQLNREWLWLDVVQFQMALTAVETHPHRHLHACASCLERLTQAAALAQRRPAGRADPARRPRLRRMAGRRAGAAPLPKPATAGGPDRRPFTAGRI
jgi:DNA-binding SARP family transcriptional activator